MHPQSGGLSPPQLQFQGSEAEGVQVAGEHGGNLQSRDLDGQVGRGKALQLPDNFGGHQKLAALQIEQFQGWEALREAVWRVGTGNGEFWGDGFQANHPVLADLMHSIRPLTATGNLEKQLSREVLPNDLSHLC